MMLKWRLLVFARLHHWFRGGRGLIVPFILSKIVGAAREVREFLLLRRKRRVHFTGVYF